MLAARIDDLACAQKHASSHKWQGRRPSARMPHLGRGSHRLCLRLDRHLVVERLLRCNFFVGSGPGATDGRTTAAQDPSESPSAFKFRIRAPSDHLDDIRYMAAHDILFLLRARTRTTKRRSENVFCWPRNKAYPSGCPVRRLSTGQPILAAHLDLAVAKLHQYALPRERTL